MIPSASLRERVARGALLLDKRGPKNWRSLINLESLDMGDPRKCIVGQLYKSEGFPSYNNGISALGLDDIEIHGTVARDVFYGFEIGDTEDSYTQLTELWVEELER